MKRFRIWLRFPSGSLLIGGYSAPTHQSHAVHAQGAKGRPLIPATALRGALRETLESLLRGADLPACSGGNGVAVGTAASKARPCTLEGSTGQRCIACRLFGTQRERIDPDERAFSGLILGPAELVTDHDAGWTLRPGVAINRRQRSAENKHVYMQRVPLLRDATFVAKGRLLDENLERFLHAAVTGTKHIGAGRSRGLGRVDLELDWVNATDAPEIDVARFPASGDVRVRVTLQSAACIGVPVVEKKLRNTRREIPGAALRGAIGFALAERLENPQDASFQELVAEDGAQFGFLYPVHPNSTIQTESAPLPLTAAACKHHRSAHGIFDTLLDRLALAHVTDRTQAEKVRESRQQSCTKCNGPLHSLAGVRGSADKLPIRTVTRVAMDRARASAQDEMLFSLVMLDAGSTFEGTIRNIPATGRSRLQEALSLPLSIGRGRSSGSGQIQVEVFSPQARESMRQRAENFEQALRKRLSKEALPADTAARLVPITLLSPLLTGEEPSVEDGAGLLLRELSAQSCFLRIRRFVREGGWDQRSGKMHAKLATAAGAVFVLDLGAGRTWRDVLDKLEFLEQHAIGISRHQGYGQVLCFDPFICSSASTRQPEKVLEMTSEDRIRTLRKGLVIAAEKVIQAAFKNEKEKIQLQKTQLNHLVGICSEATCVEEIENYIRYQAGRGTDKTGWSLALEEQVIKEIKATLDQVANLSDAERLTAWRFYAVYMTRAFTYEKAIRDPKKNNRIPASSHEPNPARLNPRGDRR